LVAAMAHHGTSLVEKLLGFSNTRSPFDQTRYGNDSPKALATDIERR
jgi:hypothetical protein